MHDWKQLGSHVVSANKTDDTKRLYWTWEADDN